jgi:hypothetical protein
MVLPLSGAVAALVAELQNIIPFEAFDHMDIFRYGACSRYCTLSLRLYDDNTALAFEASRFKR